MYDTSPDALELARLLARLKLQTRRLLDESVDLHRLQNDRAYAETRLGELEDAATEEDYLVLVLRLRAHLCPVIPNALRSDTASSVQSAPPPADKQTRHYRFGARGG